MLSKSCYFFWKFHRIVWKQSRVMPQIGCAGVMGAVETHHHRHRRPIGDLERQCQRLEQGAGALAACAGGLNEQARAYPRRAARMTGTRSRLESVGVRRVMRCRSGGLGCLLTVSGEAVFPLFGNTKQIFNGLHDNAGGFAREWYPLVNGQLRGAGINTDPHPATQGFDSLLPERSDELGGGGLRERRAEHNRDREADIVLVTVYRELPRRPFFRGGLVYFAGEQVVLIERDGHPQRQGEIMNVF